MTSEMLSGDPTQAAPLQSQMNALEAELTDLRNQRDVLYEGDMGKGETGSQRRQRQFRR